MTNRSREKCRLSAEGHTDGYLTDDQFLDVIRHAPLVSIDMLVRDSQQRLLMGRRVNEPAKGTWFVPGGRIRKGERLGQALERICREELGVAPGAYAFLGVYEHMYDTNVYAVDGVPTHYVVLAYRTSIPSTAQLSTSQHADYRWIGLEEAAGLGAQVHVNSVRYLEDLQERHP